MRLQQSHCTVAKVIPYTDTIRNFLKQNGNDESDVKELNNNILGGILSDINYTWLTKGPRLEVLSSKNGAKIAAWTFGEILKDYYTKITCVVDLPTTNSKTPVLVVGLQSGGTRGMICIFDIRTSRVLRAIQIGKPVTSIHVVDGGSESSLPGALRALDGILAVGTEEGRIYLIDLCQQACEDAVKSSNKEHIRDEITASELMQISLNDIPMLEKHKEMTLKTGDHLCIQLNEFCTENKFILKGPQGETRLRANIVEVKTSAIHYCPQLGSLLVGYNFGAFQLYNLLTIRLEYSSPAYEDCIPVSHFAFQEPCDDPRAFCYIWVMYSNIESDLPGFPLSVMYSLSYATKEYLEGYGCLYQELSACSIRFQTELKSLPTSNIQKPIGANCISLNAYTKGVQKYNAGIACHDIVEDRLALCCVVWSVFNSKDIETFMCLFDLNQWYKEQMPGSPNAEENGSYMVFASLSDLFLSSTYLKSPLLDLKMDPKSITQFTSAQRLEEHYYPSALTFKLICTRDNDIIWIESTGIQKHLLSLVKIAGPLCLLRPSDIFQQCISFGLTPFNSDISYSTETALKLQREMILNVALEHQLISWLCRCAQEWSNGSQSISGCTLEFLLNWAWQRTTTLKSTVNEICSPLFDYSGMRLDTNSLILLNDCARQLKHLSTLYEYIISRCTQFLLEARREEINLQYSALKMISVYIEVLQWLLNVGLLPECPIYMYPRPDESERISAPYPIESLLRFYKNRRQELFELQGLENVKESQSLLFIDNLIDIECGGDILHNDWKDDFGNGLYPPPSLQALLRTYLVEDVNIVFKHCIFIYVFLDLAMTLDQSRYTPIITHLIKFPAVFKLSSSIIKITQAFWQLDHGDFSTAMAQLLDPLVSNEVLQPWHHRVAVKALLAQGQHQHALLYHQVRKPPMTNLQDLLIAITVLIVNDLLKEAFHFQRQNRSECNEKDILQHFMEACDKTNKLFQVIQLPLNEVEEIALVKYLQDSRREETDNYLVQYYLQRSRFAEAFENNDKINGKSFEKQGLVGQVQLNSRNSLVQRYKSTLPSVTQDLLSHCSIRKPDIDHNLCHIIDRPDPMSVYVHTSQDKLKYKSSLIQASLQKAKETWTSLNKKSAELPFISTPKKVDRNVKNPTPIIIPTLVQFISVKDDELENEGPTPNKRQRLSPRQPIGAQKSRKSCIVTAKSLLLKLTPIVKRKPTRARIVSVSSLLDCPGSPQSILKVRKLVTKSTSPTDRGNSTTPELLENDSDNDIQPFDDLTKETVKNSIIDLSNYEIATPKNMSYLTSRKSLRTPTTPSVRFEDSRPSTPSSEGSVENMEIEAQIESPRLVKDVVETIIPIVLDTEESPTEIKVSSPLKRKLNDSVQSRRSYKNASLLNDTNKILESIDAELQTPKPEASKTQFPKVSGRKSLTRQVLEQNTISKVLSTPRMQTRLASKSNIQNNTVGVEITHKETAKSYVKEVRINKIQESSNTNVLESKNVFSTEKDLNTSCQTIKHTHNESLTKSSTKLTEFLDDSASDASIDPILAQGSDVDDSFLMKYVKDKTSNNYSSLSESISKNSDEFEDTQDDIIQDIVPEENDDIIEIQSIDDKYTTENTTEEYVTLESSENYEKTVEEKHIETQPDESVIVDLQAMETQPFEITDDLTDEDVSFTIHSTMNVEIDNSKTSNGNIMEMKDMEPENYIEPNFEEEVRNVLTEDSDIDEQYLNIEYADRTLSEDSDDKANEDTSSESSSENQQEETTHDQEIKEEDTPKTNVQSEQNEEYEEKVSNHEESDEDPQVVSDDENEADKVISSDSSDEEEDQEENDEETSEDERISDQESDAEEKVEQSVIEVHSSSEEEIMLQIPEQESEEEDSSSVDLFEKNITESNVSLEVSETSKEEQSQQSDKIIQEDDIPTLKSEQTMNIEEQFSMEVAQEEKVNMSSTNEQTVTAIIVETKETCEITIPAKVSTKQFEDNTEIYKPSTSKEANIKEKPKRTTRASSVIPVGSTENIRITRGRSVEVEMMSSSQKNSSKSEENTVLRANRRIKKSSNQTETIKEDSSTDDKIMEIVAEPEENKEIDTIHVEKAKLPLRKGRLPSVQKEIPAPIPTEEKQGQSHENLDDENSEKKIPAKQGGKLSKEVVTETVLCQEEPQTESLENIEDRNIEPIIPAKRGRKPSVIKETTEKVVSHEEVTEAIMCHEEPKSECFENKEDENSENIIPSKTGIQKETTENFTSHEELKSESPENKTSEKVIPAKRGRKPSVQKETTEIISLEEEPKSESLQNVVEKDSEKVTSSRRGRKPSQQEIDTPIQQTQSTSTPKEVLVEEKSKKGKILESIVSTPTKRGRKTSVHSEEQSEVLTPLRRSRRTSLQSIEPIIQETEVIGTPSRRITRKTSIQSEQGEPKPSTPVRRTRRLTTQSDDANITFTPSRRVRRPSVQSEDIEVTPSRRTRASSVFSEEKSPAKSGSESVSSKISTREKIEEYAATHRLTRRQKAMIEEMMKKKGLHLADIDPLLLLDKESFSGEPDLEEEHHSLSPTSSICTESSVGTRSSARIQNKRATPDKPYRNSPSLISTPQLARVTRGTAKLLESSLLEDEPADENEPSTSSGSRVKRKSSATGPQLISSPVVKKQRRLTLDSLVSETDSIQSEAVVKLKRLHASDIERLRHRSLSPSVLKQGSANDSPRRGSVRNKTRLSVLGRTELSKISEENTSIESEITSKAIEESKISAKRGRPKKS